ncbi:MAG: LytR C-terminal domain-containing protein [Gemmatimonadales bacterium]
MGLLEQPRRGTLLVVALIALGLVLAAFATWFRLHGRPDGAPRADRDIPGADGRIVVEVLNTTRALGLARAATHVLRDGGIDVVGLGSDTGKVLDSTQVLVRRGSLQAGERVAKVLGVGTARAMPDPGRLVDVTVRLGRDFLARAGAGNP